MPIPAYIRRAIDAWQAWRTRERIYRAMPERRALDAAIAKGRKDHLPVAPLLDERRRMLHEELKREVGSVR
jgi:hypothetical protein